MKIGKNTFVVKLVMDDVQFGEVVLEIGEDFTYSYKYEAIDVMVDSDMDKVFAVADLMAISAISDDRGGPDVFLFPKKYMKITRQYFINCIFTRLNYFKENNVKFDKKMYYYLTAVCRLASNLFFWDIYNEEEAEVLMKRAEEIIESIKGGR